MILIVDIDVARISPDGKKWHPVLLVRVVFLYNDSLRQADPATENRTTGYNSLKSQIAQSRMIVRPASDGPVKQPFRLSDREIIDAGVARLHEAALVELPIFIAITSPPLPGGIMAF